MVTEMFRLLSDVPFEVFTFLMKQLTEIKVNPLTSTFYLNPNFQAKRIILKIVST